MSKPRDQHGNDFIAPCGWLAGLLHIAKYGKIAETSDDSEKMKRLSSDLYNVVMRHWKEWGE